MFLAMLFKRDKGEFSLLIVIAAGMLIFFYENGMDFFTFKL